MYSYNWQYFHSPYADHNNIELAESPAVDIPAAKIFRTREKARNIRAYKYKNGLQRLKFFL